jgi:hypothetical protein
MLVYSSSYERELLWAQSAMKSHEVFLLDGESLMTASNHPLPCRPDDTRTVRSCAGESKSPTLIGCIFKSRHYPVISDIEIRIACG